MLYIVSTPIGNMGDFSLRAIETLRDCDLILAEDTRRTGILLKHHSIENRMESFNEASEKRKLSGVMDMLRQGKNIALVSDGGTPAISDPGFMLVRECVKEGIKVSPVPGASAAIAAVSCSGLPTDRFTFYGFAPKKNGKMKELLETIKERDETAILYESPHRVMKTLEAIAAVMPDRPVVLARELTKKFEEFMHGTASVVRDLAKERTIKGEIVLLIGK